MVCLASYSLPASSLYVDYVIHRKLKICYAGFARTSLFSNEHSIDIIYDALSTGVHPMSRNRIVGVD